MACWKVGRFVQRIVSGIRPVLHLTPSTLLLWPSGGTARLYGLAALAPARRPALHALARPPRARARRVGRLARLLRARERRHRLGLGTRLGRARIPRLLPLRPA